MTIDPAVRAQWAAVAERYGTGWARAGGADLDWLVEALEPRPGERALDLGSGAGHAALAVAPHVAEVVATDPTPEMLAVAGRLAAERGIANIRLVEAPAEALPFPDRSFDLAFSRHAVHHWPDPGAALREIGRVLRPGGRFAAIDSLGFEDGPSDAFLVTVELLRDPTHVRALSQSSWLRLLAEAGFSGDVARTWDLRQETEPWLANTNPPSWRADAVRALLREAPERIRSRLRIAPDAASFVLYGALVVARLEGRP